MHYIEIIKDYSGQRIDNFLLSYCKTLPKSVIYRIIRIGLVRINKKRIKFYYKLITGDILKIPSFLQTINNEYSKFYTKKEIVFLKKTVIYEDDSLLILNKPTGIAVHGGSGLKFGVIEGLRILWPKKQFLELVHRLDRDTSGVLLIAKNRSSLVFLHNQLRCHKIKKEYLALITGLWNMNSTVISVPLLNTKSTYNKNTNFSLVDFKHGKISKTYFQVKEYFDNMATLLLVRPVTGRTHQIRIHLQHVKHPIIGDRIYGNHQVNIYFKKLSLNRLFLHASSLCFLHPNTKKKFHICAPIDQSFNNCLSFLRNFICNSQYNMYI